MKVKLNALKINVLIAEKGCRRSDFCKICGISSNSLLRLSKANEASVTIALKVAKGLSVPLTELMTDEEQRRKINEQSNLNG